MSTPRPAASFGFAVQTLISQVIGCSVAFISWPAHHSVLIALIVSTTCAYCAAKFLNLPPSWKLINTLLPTACALNLSLEVPSWIFSAPLVLLLLTYAPALWTRVPYYPTPKAAYALILAELPSDRHFTFVDIGCGFGDLVHFLSTKRPLGRFIGIEVGPLPWLAANLKKLLLRRRNLEIQYYDMWRFPLAEIDVAYTFLSPAAMPRMWHKVVEEMRPGTCFITLSFPVPAQCDEVITVKDERASQLYIHRIGSADQAPLRVGQTSA